MFPVISGDQAEITCKSCGAVVRTVSVADLQRTYDEIELSLDAKVTEMCPHCGKVNILPRMIFDMAYACRDPVAGAAVRRSEHRQALLSR